MTLIQCTRKVKQSEAKNMSEDYEVINEHYIRIKSTGKHLNLKQACELLNTYERFHKASTHILKKIGII